MNDLQTAALRVPTQPPKPLEIRLLPGEMAVADGAVITTLLGSCISVCLWSPEPLLGGMNHYIMPEWNGLGDPSPRFGNVAISDLIAAMIARGAKRHRLTAMMFGGASMFHSSGESPAVGSQNIAVGLRLLGAEGISVVSNDVGGLRGRRVTFYTDTGRIVSNLV